MSDSLTASISVHELGVENENLSSLMFTISPLYIKKTYPRETSLGVYIQVLIVILFES